MRRIAELRKIRRAKFDKSQTSMLYPLRGMSFALSETIPHAPQSIERTSSCEKSRLAEPEEETRHIRRKMAAFKTLRLPQNNSGRQTMKRQHLIARAVILEDGKVLLARCKGADNTFLPGGHVFSGESLKKAGMRGVPSKGPSFVHALPWDEH